MRVEIFTEIFVPLLTGGLIGYVTNEIAIKMLFRPRKAVYIKNWRVPFTPGLIPKEKERIANSIGKIVSDKILNSEVIARALNSEAIVEKLRASVNSFFEENRSNENTVEDYLSEIFPGRILESFIEEVKNESAALLYNELVKAKFGEVITENILQKLREGKNRVLSKIFVKVINEKLSEGISKSVGEQIDRIINDNAENIIKDILNDKINQIKKMRVGDIIDKYYDKRERTAEFIIEIYKKIICENTANILAGLNIEKIIEERISSFDVIELEDMIFAVMSRELKAIIYLGAFLGLIIGIINIIF